MDLNQAGSGNDEAGRTSAFRQGSSGNPYRVASSMGQDSGWSDPVGRAFHPSSVLNQVTPVQNGEASQDFSRKLPGGVTLPTSNGTDATTYQQLQVMRMIGKPY